ncbi:AEC family transporter [Ornithinimicrobium tianjinense]|uniref:Membrane protein n=1 Tax=Ornithinimicrobium tianjinense TaxID=1195761 RepID=A0A917BNQ8_9MICO|nr:AEC family transporter [Ornithinimicrobium tianjinense]GGF51111.1 membrane protein [Ornithinimicrobium tianjinense]
MVAVLQGFWLIAAVVAVGWVLAHTRLFGATEQRVLARLTFWVGSPALLFLVVADADVHVLFSGFLLATLAGILVTAAAYLLLARVVLRRPLTHTLMGGMGVTYVNSNNLGVPIAAYVLGDAQWAAPILLVQLLFLQPTWLAALDASGEGRVSLGRLLRSPFTNPLTIGSLLGLAVALSGVTVPPLVRDPAELVGGLAIPGMLLAFGISLRLSPPPRGKGTLAELGLMVLLKLGLMPLVAWSTAVGLGLSEQEVLAAAVMSSLPTAQNVFVLAVAYRRAETVARDCVFATTLLAMPAMLVVVALVGGA